MKHFPLRTWAILTGLLVLCLAFSTNAAAQAGTGTLAGRVVDDQGGAIPGAIHLEWTNNLDANGFFKSDEELRKMYTDHNIGPDKEVIPHCHGGYRSAHTYLALRLIGYPKVRNYLGSWGEWGNKPELPIEIPKQP